MGDEFDHPHGTHLPDPTLGSTPGDNVIPDERWSRYMKAALPEPATVFEEVMQLSASYSGVIDCDRLLGAVESAVWDRLYELTARREDIRWDSLCLLRASGGFDHRRLAAFLSTRGAVGIAVNDKLSGYLTRLLPRQLTAAVYSGRFDAA
ncbi:hypothetical protein [Rhodococcus sp. 1168]|uniref:hypothetical protein n=1 Tax=Rhodococcus sp. 1168 TaxID=2018041 RepID=UPI000A0CE594|nr:hypothetical protein [Rhodococcus sp. 1168]ORI21164.1 hypothetical protein BJI47_17125 [Rhodococcus sp. 1168]